MKKWFSLVLIKPINGNIDLGNAEGAYVTIGCRANTKEDYISKVKQVLENHNYKPLEFDELQNEDEVMQEIKDSDTEIFKINKNLDKGFDFEWGTFFPY